MILLALFIFSKNSYGQSHVGLYVSTPHVQIVAGEPVFWPYYYPHPFYYRYNYRNYYRYNPYGWRYYYPNKHPYHYWHESRQRGWYKHRR